jgi:hypothetical protein
MPRYHRQFLKHGTLPQMAVFEAIVRLGSFSCAAQAMHIAQPTVSGLVRRLSDAAGKPLFQKIGRRMAPTAAGRRVYAAATEIFDALERMGTDLAALSDAQTTSSQGDCVLTSRARISLGVNPSAEAPKNGIPNRRVRAPRWSPLLHAADCSPVHMRVSTAYSEGTRKSQTGVPYAMDDTIDHSIVFAKTPKGVAEINARSGALSLQTRRVLIMIDGNRPVAELMAVVRTGEFDGIISTLESQNMIEKVDLSSLPPRDYEQEDFADTISLLQENAAALRGMPHVNPATLVQNPVAARAPATITAEQNMEPATDAATIAARAVATASAPRPNDAAMKRPPTISMPSPVANDMAAGTARPGTLTGTVRAPDPVRRPPTLSGARPAPVNEPAAVAVEAPVRPAPATIRAEAAPASAAPAAAVATPAAAAATPASAVATPASAVATPAAAAPAAAPAAATTPPPRTLEEEKRLAVSELYSVLGPYGEQPVAKLQECMTMDALREQIKQAGKRVATFRGEKAAQDYLRAVGHA